ncbi:hypothetical protein E4U52_000722 [Claviceps spartinae]|nr:hypothetical protein E4U52_000722 [Claviceps spartinae]
MAEIWLSENAAISPCLKGAENYQEWEISVMLQAQAMRLAQHLAGETPYSNETDKHHARLTCLIWGSLSPRIQRSLVVAGWEAAMPAPKLMEFIRSECFCNSDFAIMDLLHRFSESRNSDFPSIRSWLDHHQDLWYRINMVEKIPDIVWVSQTVKAVQDSMPQVHEAWTIKSFSGDRLKKENMLAYLLKEANRQSKDREEAKSNPRKKTKAKSKTQNRNGTREVVILDCGCPVRPGRVIHAMNDCWTLHPEKKPGAMKKQAKPTTTSSPVKSPAESLNHIGLYAGSSSVLVDDDSSAWSVAGQDIDEPYHLFLPGPA